RINAKNTSDYWILRIFFTESMNRTCLKQASFPCLLNATTNTATSSQLAYRLARINYPKIDPTRPIAYKFHLSRRHEKYHVELRSLRKALLAVNFIKSGQGFWITGGNADQQFTHQVGHAYAVRRCDGSRFNLHRRLHSGADSYHGHRLALPGLPLYGLRHRLAGAQAVKLACVGRGRRQVVAGTIIVQEGGFFWIVSGAVVDKLE